MITALGTVLGTGMVILFFGWWIAWLAGLILLEIVDSISKRLLHRKNIVQGSISPMTD